MFFSFNGSGGGIVGPGADEVAEKFAFAGVLATGDSLVDKGV